MGKTEQGTYSMYLVEKQNQVDYSILHTLLEKAAVKPGIKEMRISKEEMHNLLSLAEIESERELLKCIVVKATGLSSTKAKSFYGFINVRERKEKVESAMEKAVSIRESIEKTRSFFLLLALIVIVIPIPQVKVKPIRFVLVA